MLEVKIKRNPYGDGLLFKRGTIELLSGINVIIGRNGCGKTTFCYETEEFCKKHNIKCYKYDNYIDGGDNARQEYLMFGDMEALASTAFHSEGEQIFYNMRKQIVKISNFISANQKEKQLVIILDALDSGLDIDGIEQVKAVMNMITIDGKEHGIDIYFVITANNYALIHEQRCIDIKTGNIYHFDDYISFKKFIEKQYDKDKSKTKS